MLHTFSTKRVKVKKKFDIHASDNDLAEVVLRGEPGRQPNSLLILCIMAAMTTLGVMISVYYHLVQYVLKYAPILQAGRSRSISGA